MPTDPADITRQRIAALMLVLPSNQMNFTTALDAATWMIAEAGRLGWSLTVEDAGPDKVDEQLVKRT